VFTSVPLRRYAEGEDGEASLPAKLWLTCAAMIRDADTWQPTRYAKQKPVPGVTLPEGERESKFVLPIRQDDIQQIVSTSYSIDQTTGEGSVLGTSDNVDDCDTRADYYIESKLKEFETPNALTLTYQLLVPIDMDGAINQVSYRISKSGADTKVSRGTEHDLSTPSYREKQERALRGKLGRESAEAEVRSIRKELRDLK
jgi:hypothetical protein